MYILILQQFYFTAFISSLTIRIIAVVTADLIIWSSLKPCLYCQKLRSFVHGIERVAMNLKTTFNCFLRQWMRGIELDVERSPLDKMSVLLTREKKLISNLCCLRLSHCFFVDRWLVQEKPLHNMKLYLFWVSVSKTVKVLEWTITDTKDLYSSIKLLRMFPRWIK